MKQAPGQNGHEYFIAQQMEVVNMMPGEYPQPTSFPDAMMLESMPQEPWVGAPFDFPMEGYSFDGNQIRRTSTGEASVEATSSGDSGRSSLPPADLKKAKEQERQEVSRMTVWRLRLIVDRGEEHRTVQLKGNFDNEGNCVSKRIQHDSKLLKQK